MKTTEWTNQAMRTTRYGLHLSQWELAAMTQLSQTTVWAIESGYKKPSQEQKDLIAGALGSTPEELFS